MRKCARCNDFLVDHTCQSCHLRHQCRDDEKCECHRYPNLPSCVGHNFTPVYLQGSRGLHSFKLKRRYRVNSQAKKPPYIPKSYFRGGNTPRQQNQYIMDQMMKMKEKKPPYFFTESKYEDGGI